MRSITRALLPSAISIALSACGGSKPPPEEPEAEAATSSEGSEAAEDESEAPADTEDDSEPAEEAESASSSPGRSPKDVLTGGEDVLFMFSFNASEAYQEAEKQCAEKAGDDLKKKADCLSKASKKFDVDGFAFQQDDEGNWWWLTLRRTGSTLVTLHKIQIEFGKETDSSLTIKTIGRDKGSRPMAKVPAEVVFEVPSTSEIVIDDPKNGKMVYQAKLGLLGEAKR